MTRICVIGNSHVGAIKAAWDEIQSDYPETSLTFFAGRSSSTEGLIPKDGILVPKTKALADQMAFTSGGRSQIDPAQYDIFLIYGMLKFPKNPESYKTISQAFLWEFIKDTAQSSLLVSQARKIREITAKKIFAAPPPVPAHKNDTPPQKMPSHADVVAFMQVESFDDFNCIVVPQPKETLADARSTLRLYSAGSSRLGMAVKTAEEKHPDQDNIHMNTAYGKLWLGNFLRNLQDVH